MTMVNWKKIFPDFKTNEPIDIIEFEVIKKYMNLS